MSIHLLQLLVAMAMMFLLLPKSIVIISQYSQKALGANE
jgi:hypothetical protein